MKIIWGIEILYLVSEAIVLSLIIDTWVREWQLFRKSRDSVYACIQLECQRATQCYPCLMFGVDN